jgi:hypothetical protein
MADGRWRRPSAAWEGAVETLSVHSRRRGCAGAEQVAAGLAIKLPTAPAALRLLLAVGVTAAVGSWLSAAVTFHAWCIRGDGSATPLRGAARGLRPHMQRLLQGGHPARTRLAAPLECWWCGLAPFGPTDNPQIDRRCAGQCAGLLNTWKKATASPTGSKI